MGVRDDAHQPALGPTVIIYINHLFTNFMDSKHGRRTELQMVRMLTLLLFVALPMTAHAGAWPREKRSVFLSWSSSISAQPNSLYSMDNSIYAEYGLTPRLTVGIDGFLGARGKSSEAYLFMRLPIGKRDGPARMALTFGLGKKIIPNPWGTTTHQTRSKLGFSWGRGLKKGWLAFDLSASLLLRTSLHVPGQAGTNYSADFTWGQKPSDRFMFIWQLQTGKITNGPFFAKFAPSFVWSFGAQKSNSIEIGMIKGLTGDDSKSVKLGFWKSF